MFLIDVCVEVDMVSNDRGMSTCSRSEMVPLGRCLLGGMSTECLVSMGVKR